ncbi:DUF2087 domain-containing protein [Rugosimonospora acidiphila]|uniref:DUF2087 domain-containing protein n=2 Tax=Rugosimonospora acidiphila TaxID=556531 RepID=A0ABP9RPJ1_9ACTN
MAVRLDALCGLLAEEERLRSYAAVVLGAGTPGEVAQATGLGGRDVMRALRRLEEGGLLSTVDGRYVARAATFKDAIREHAPAPLPDVPLDPDQERDAVLRSFVREGRLVRMPAARGKRRVVLEYIAGEFDPGVRYPEPAVNAMLRVWHDDYAALRRYLVDEDLLSRQDGVYWRSGGYVNVE